MEQTIGNSSAESPVVDAFYAKLNRKHLPSLDGLRGIAALLVVFYHFGIEFGFHPPPGYLGVLIFFVLSGFLITWLLLKESSATGTVSLSGFYLRRSLRIFPAFYGFWLFSIGVRILGHRTIAWGAAIASFFYVSNYYYSLVPGADTFMLHTWSLANEEQFYLLWPWVFKRAHNNLSRITVFLITAIALIWVYRPILKFLFHAPRNYLQYAFDCRVDALFAGCLLSILLKRKACDRFVATICGRTYFSLLPVFLLVADTQIGDRLGPLYSQIVGFPVEITCTVALLVQLIAFSESALWRWLNSRPAKFFGAISYSLYLYQNASFKFLPQPLRDIVVQGPIWGKVLGGLVLSIGVASLSYYVIEKFFLRLKDKLSIPKVAETAPSTTS
ncbi:MAG TPA: acyltransferase [Candidatus Acidoferrum sp.]|nr:acyltransferase [Candidatus Acidoferrum sp.]